MKDNILNFINDYEYFKVEGIQTLNDIKKSMINCNIYDNYIEYEMNEKEKTLLTEILNEHCYLDIMRISKFLNFIGKTDCDESLNVAELKKYKFRFKNFNKKDLYDMILSNEIYIAVDFRMYYHNDIDEDFRNINIVLEKYMS